MGSNKKPFGLIVTAFYAALAAVLVIPPGLAMLFAGQISGGVGVLFSIGGLLFCVFGFALLAAVYGLWSLQDWGRKLMFWISAVSIPLGVVSIFPIWPGQAYSVGNTIPQLFGIGISALIIYYLTREHIKQLFSDYGP